MISALIRASVLGSEIAAGVFAAGLLAADPVGALFGLPAQVVSIGGWICLAAALLMIVAARQAVPGAALVGARLNGILQ